MKIVYTWIIATTTVVFLFSGAAIGQSCSATGQAFFVAWENCTCNGYEYPHNNCSGITGRCNNRIQFPCGDTIQCTFLTAQSCPSASAGKDPLSKDRAVDPIQSSLIERLKTEPYSDSCVDRSAKFARWANSQFRSPQISKVEAGQ